MERPVLTIRSGKLDDLETLSKIGGDAEDLSLHLMLSSTRIFVAELQKPVGWGMARRLEGAAVQGDSIPSGWYLTGLEVARSHRRQGVGRSLTLERISWLQGQTNVVRYFTDADNKASIALHREFGFHLVREDLCGETLRFGKGTCLLFEKHFRVLSP